jgi:hypothetical protein
MCMYQIRRKDGKDSFYEELQQVFDNFPYPYEISVRKFVIQNLGERIFSNREFGMRAHIRIVVITVLE